MQRADKPHDLEPCLKGRVQCWTIDLRPWGGSRYLLLRNPKKADWLDRGRRSESSDIADQWKWGMLIATARGTALLSHLVGACCCTRAFTGSRAV